jgi:ABC-type dipeptide/oligopeptide/nickel transport system permease subunit
MGGKTENSDYHYYAYRRAHDPRIDRSSVSGGLLARFKIADSLRLVASTQLKAVLLLGTDNSGRDMLTRT